MKNKNLKYTILSFFILTIIIGSIYNQKQKYDQKMEKDGPMSFGTKNIPSSRLGYDLMRFKSPLTNTIPLNIRYQELLFGKTLPKSSNLKSGLNINWKQRGPYNVGGRTRAIAFDVNDENIIMAGGVSGGLWRSENGGMSFSKLTNPETIHSISCIAQNKRKGKTNVWYYGTGEYYALVGPTPEGFSGNGIFKSIDGGKTWKHLESTISNTPTTLYNNGDFDFIWKIIVDNKDSINDVVYAALFNGIYRSADGGDSWTAVLGLHPNETNYSDFVDIAQTSDGVLYATLSSGGIDKGIWRSTDGIDWTNISPDFMPNSYRRTCIGIAPSNENIVYFVSETPGEGKNNHSVWAYEYLGGNGDGQDGKWDDRSANLPEYNCTIYYDFEFGNYSTQSSFDMFIKVKPDNENVVFLGGTNLYRSKDGFRSDTMTSWIGGYKCNLDHPSDYNYPNHHPDQHDLIFYPSNSNSMLSANDGGLYKTNNCIDSVFWIPLNNGYVTTQFYTVAIESGNGHSDYVIGGMQDNGTWGTNSLDSKKAWKNLLGGDGSFCHITKNRKYLYMSWQTGKTFKYEIDDSLNVIAKTRIDAKKNNEAPYLFINPFLIDPNNENIMYMACNAYIWRNNDLSQIELINDEINPIDTNWKYLKNGNTGYTGAFITAMEMPLYPKDLLIYGASDGQIFYIEDIWATSPKRVKINTSIIPYGYISSISANKYNGDEIIATLSNYELKSVFYTKDRGKTWESISGNLEENPDGTGKGPSVLCSAIYPTNDKTYYFVGTTIGLFYTTDLKGDETVWIQEGSNTIGNVVINMIKTRSYDGMIAIATHGNGIYTSNLPAYTNIKYIEKTLGSNNISVSPNPFAEYTNIQYETNEISNVKIYIYNSSGKIILNDNFKSKTGKNIYKWTGKDNNIKIVSKGLYYIIYEMKNEKHTTKVIKF
ncbi:MAG TPA: hypothetical protein DEG71_09950 [Clostridiales bacterium]|nr:hypothetical protein [Clostridiales bacterium]